MSRGSTLLLAQALAGCAHSPGLGTHESWPASGLHLTTRTVRYAVTGASIPELRRLMGRIGPIDDGAHQFSFTWGTFAWHWPSEERGGHCVTGPVELELELVQTFPEWIRPRRVVPTALREWRRWLDATRAHEDDHRRILLETAQEILARIAAVGPRPTCEDHDREANAAAQAALERMRAAHATLDRTTEHGATTGAILRDP